MGNLFSTTIKKGIVKKNKIKVATKTLINTGRLEMNLSLLAIIIKKVAKILLHKAPQKIMVKITKLTKA